MLLVRLFPDAEVLDGIGGDEGRDVQLRIGDDLIIYELKSFTGRLSPRSPNRRRQVEKSLAQAAKLDPKEWYLVVPINHNPTELKWFDGLKKTYPFVRKWRGLTWLNTQLASHPDLVRSALRDVEGEILDAIGEYRAERDMLANGVPDVVARIEALHRRADEISPHYRVEVGRVDGRTEVNLHAKHPQAAEDAPVTITGTFKFPDTAEGNDARQRFENAFAFGESVELSEQFLGPFDVTAPPELGLDETFQPSLVSLAAVRQPIDPPLRAIMRVVNSAGLPVSGLEVTFATRYAGHAGVVLHGRDITGFLAIRLQVDVVQRTSSLTLSIGNLEPAAPAALLPALRMLTSMKPGNMLRIDINVPHAEPLINSPVTEELVDGRLHEFVGLVEELAVIQDRTRTMFAVPDVLTHEDVAEIHRASQLLAGEHVPLGDGVVQFTLTPHDPENYTAGLEGDFRLAATSESTLIEIASQTLDLGPSVTYLRRGRLVDRGVLTRPAPAESITLDIELLDGGHLSQALGGIDQVPA